jgi:hypothetical protein
MFVLMSVGQSYCDYDYLQSVQPTTSDRFGKHAIKVIYTFIGKGDIVVKVSACNPKIVCVFSFIYTGPRSSICPKLSASVTSLVVEPATEDLVCLQRRRS